MRTKILHLSTRFALVLAVLTMTAGAWAVDNAAEYQRGLDLYKAGKYLPAVGALQRVAASDKELAPEARLQLGNMHLEHGMLDSAISEYLRGLDAVSVPKNQQIVVEILRGLGDAYAQAGRDSEHAEEIGWLELNTQLLTQDRIDAINTLDQMLSRYASSPNAARYVVLTGDIFISHATKDEVRLLLETLEQRNRNYAGYFFSRNAKTVLGMLFEMTGRIDDAVSTVSMQYGEKPTTEQAAQIMCDIAGIYFRAERYKDAISALNDQIKFAKNIPEYGARAEYELGLCYMHLDDMEAARQHMLSAAHSSSDKHLIEFTQHHLNTWSKRSKSKEVGK